MKLLLFIFLTLFASFSMHPTKNLHQFSMPSIDGKSTINFKDFEGKYVLLVNTASKCGYTPQYKTLQALQDQYASKLVVIGVPCNQFGGQEPGTEEEIADFCSLNFGVKFALTAKADVKGKNQADIYKYITQQELDNTIVAAPEWNFHKYLFSPNGDLIGSFASGVSPVDALITSMLE